MHLTLLRFQQAIVPEKRFNFGFSTTKLTEDVHRMTAASLSKHGISKSATGPGNSGFVIKPASSKAENASALSTSAHL